MRKVIAAVFVSLDGVMQAPGAQQEDPTRGFKYGGWVFQYGDEVVGQTMGETFSAPFDLLLGRKTYEIFAAYWPFRPAGDPIAEPFNRVTKYVATRSGQSLEWNKSVALRDAATDVAKLKQQDGPRLLIQGSSNLIQTLLQHDLIDEFRLLIFPVVFGTGKRLFGEGTIPAGLKMVDSKISPNGVIITRYERAGAVKTGALRPDEPSAAEIERRERMKREG